RSPSICCRVLFVIFFLERFVPSAMPVRTLKARMGPNTCEHGNPCSFLNEAPRGGRLTGAIPGDQTNHRAPRAGAARLLKRANNFRFPHATSVEAPCGCLRGPAVTDVTG